ncbi:hypothetical protein F4677DRAFT_437683 [Hypoxylon crocopeplum]|nr:hypothetical protein F4677DRAFT_437683 [Hypoxylon crocopeplum]
MASPAQDHRASLSPYAPTQAAKGCDSRSIPRIIVPPTPDNQRIYNEIRQTLERLNLQTHVASQQNLLPPSSAPSISTVYSPTDEPGTPSTYDITAHDTDRPKRPRGRRRGPLEAHTRLNTALKRKLKLACPHHRAKKITCDCHDFSKLEEIYDNSQLSQPSNRSRSRDQVDIPSLTPIERALNRETFGTGGGVMASPDQDAASNDLVDILESSSSDHEGVVRPNVQQIVNEFDTRSVHLGVTMRQARGQPYHPGNDMGAQLSRGHVQNEFLEIGSQNQAYPNRWHCEFKGSADSMSEPSSEPCPWTGPIHQLPNHFRAEHHAFQDASPRFWVVCTTCGAKGLAQDDLEPSLSPSRCTTGSCSGSCQRWYYGSTREESVLGSVVALTQSSESDAGYSWNLQPEGNQSWLRGGGSNGRHYSHFGAGNPQERSNFHHAKWDTSSDSSGHSSNCGRHRRDYFLARKERPRWRQSDPEMKGSHSVSRPRYLSHRCPIRLISYAKLPVRHLLSILLPLLTTIVRESGHIFASDPLSSSATDASTISWCSLGLLLIGFIATWTFKGRARSWTIDEVSEGIPQMTNSDPNVVESDDHTPSRQGPRIRVPHDEISSWYRFDTLITA